jgi:hypothetical protein
MTTHEQYEILETHALLDYNLNFGKTMRVDQIDGLDRRQISTTIFAPVGKSFLVRLIETNQTDLFHWNDDFIDPYWNIEVIDACGLDSEMPEYPWIFGPSYEANPGRY